MTPDQLRSLVAEATGGPWEWKFTDRDSALRGKDGNCIVNPGLVRGRNVYEAVNHPADARLIALAPQLAQEHADLMEWAHQARDALAAYEGFYDDDCGDPDCGDCVPGRNLRALLAGFPLGNNEEASDGR